MHDLPLITTIAVAFTAAWLLGLLTQRLGLSPIVGYLIAGILIGPYSPGFVGDLQLTRQLAEVGVILLMFGVGLHFRLKDLLAVKDVAVPGAVGQSLGATILAIVVFTALGLPVKSGAVIGMAMAVASTVVLVRVLLDAGVLDSPPGHVAVGWLIVEDIFTVVLLVLIPMLGQTPGAAETAGPNLWAVIALALLKLALLVAVVMFAGSRIIPWVLVRVARLRSRELFTLTVLVFSIAMAAGAYFFFGASMALGAFLAGMVVAQSPVSHQAAADALPMRDAFAVLFFVSVGMLFDPRFVLQQPPMILAALGIILIAKPLLALLIVALLGRSIRTALTVALGLAQIGEFSFILSEQAREYGLMPDAGHHVLVAAAILSITLNPTLFSLLPRIESWLRRRPCLWRLLNNRAERRIAATNLAAASRLAKPTAATERLAIVVGFGPVGRSVHRLLRDAGLTTVVIDFNMDTVSTVTAQGLTAIFGDASHESILEQAGVKRASHVVLTLPGASNRASVVTAIRTLSPTTKILVRAHYLSEREDLEQAGANAAVFEEAEAAVGLARLVLADTGMHREAAERKIKDLRLQLVSENLSSMRAQQVRNLMVPWTRVQRISLSAGQEDVFRQLAQQRYSRWPVVDPQNGRVVGYLLAKDLIAASAGQDWNTLLRPVLAIGPDNDVEATLGLMQSEGATLCVVEDRGIPLGLITFEDIVEQVFGRMEDEYPHEAEVSLANAVAVGGAILDLAGSTRDEVIRELAATLPADKLPPQANIAELALAREAEVSTDLGVGVAVPHARCPNLRTPLVVFGRSSEGIMFSPQARELVQLLLLLVTPAEQGDVQLSLLAQVATVAGDASARERLRRASSAPEVIEIIAAKHHPRAMP